MTAWEICRRDVAVDASVGVCLQLPRRCREDQLGNSFEAMCCLACFTVFRGFWLSSLLRYVGEGVVSNFTGGGFVCSVCSSLFIDARHNKGALDFSEANYFRSQLLRLAPQPPFEKTGMCAAP